MMPTLAIGFGGLLTVVGLVFFVITGMDRYTALIPLAFGIPLIALGIIGRSGDRARKHAMHVAAAVALLGTLGGFVMALRPAPPDRPKSPVAVTEQVLMGAICAVFLGLCVKSFVDARRGRTTPPV